MESKLPEIIETVYSRDAAEERAGENGVTHDCLYCDACDEYWDMEFDDNSNIINEFCPNPGCGDPAEVYMVTIAESDLSPEWWKMLLETGTTFNNVETMRKYGVIKG